MVAEEDTVEECGRDHDEFAAATDTVGAAVDPEDVGRAEAFSFASDEDRTGALESLTLRWRWPDLVRIAQNRDIIHGPHRVSLTLVQKSLEF